MKNKLIFVILVISNLVLNFSSLCAEIFIKAKVNNEIITNLDIKNEKNYLIALNPKLKNLEINKLNRYAIDSIINEKIKKIEIEKFFDLSEDKNIIDNVLIDLYSNIGITNVNEFEKYLNDFGISIDQVKKKISIEISWNEYIVKKYSYAIVIDKNKIIEKIEKMDEKNFVENFLISEIVFTLSDGEKLSDKFKLIKDSIDNIGFEETAKIYSLSESKSNGGNVGWVYKSQLTKKISDQIEKVDIGQYTNPISAPGGFIVLKLINKKNEKLKIDKKEQFKNAVNYEKNRQLTRYSTLQYKRIFNKAVINEF